MIDELYKLAINSELNRGWINDREAKRYRVGFTYMSLYLNEQFLDIPRLVNENERFNVSGYTYFIPYVDSSMLYSDSEVMLLAVYKTENNSVFCPLSIVTTATGDSKDCKIIVRFQDLERTEKELLLECDGETMYTFFADDYVAKEYCVEELTLTKLLQYQEDVLKACL